MRAYLLGKKEEMVGWTYFMGWVPTGEFAVPDGQQIPLKPMMGPAHDDGIRNAVIFPNQDLVRQALAELGADSPEFIKGLVVLDCVIQEV